MVWNTVTRLCFAFLRIAAVVLCPAHGCVTQWCFIESSSHVDACDCGRKTNFPVNRSEMAVDWVVTYDNSFHSVSFYHTPKSICRCPGWSKVNIRHLKNYIFPSASGWSGGARGKMCKSGVYLWVTQNLRRPLFLPLPKSLASDFGTQGHIPVSLKTEAVPPPHKCVGWWTYAHANLGLASHAHLHMWCK